MEREIKIFVVNLALVILGHAYPGGAPTDVCTSMIPGHGVEPQTSPPPYTLQTDLRSEGQLMITIKANKSGDTFKGFMLQVRNKFDQPFGEFKPTNESKLMNCPPGVNNSVTHNSNTEKTKVEITWQCPSHVNGTKFKGEALAIATVVREKSEFWLNIREEKLVYISLPE